VAAEGKPIVLDDVESFPGHIACDGESRSEIVVPIVREGRVVGVIDVDCAEYGLFDQVDRENLEKLAEVLGKGCDW
jgi:L-methionine (R)-S-oxide reductase